MIVPSRNCQPVLQKTSQKATFAASSTHQRRFSGRAFYTMQIIAYLTDVYRGDIAPQKNPAKYVLSLICNDQFQKKSPNDQINPSGKFSFVK